MKRKTAAKPASAKPVRSNFAAFRAKMKQPQSVSSTVAMTGGEEGAGETKTFVDSPVYDAKNVSTPVAGEKGRGGGLVRGCVHVALAVTALCRLYFGEN